MLGLVSTVSHFANGQVALKTLKMPHWAFTGHMLVLGRWSNGQSSHRLSGHFRTTGVISDWLI